uniref:DUF1653 domain-containing protein n=1 Tax=Angiostrongylus cantonensis TaxID=6313 RepID=A0A0K0CZ12_ANGCA
MLLSLFRCKLDKTLFTSADALMSVGWCSFRIQFIAKSGRRCSVEQHFEQPSVTFVALAIDKYPYEEGVTRFVFCKESGYEWMEVGRNSR